MGTIRYFFWRAWLPDGLVIDQFDVQGKMHLVQELTEAGPPMKVGWVNFSLERAKKFWSQGHALVPQVQKASDEKVIVMLVSSDGRMILPSGTTEATIDMKTKQEKQEMVAYHLEHPLKMITLLPNGTVTEFEGAKFFKANDLPIKLGNQSLNAEFQLK